MDLAGIDRFADWIAAHPWIAGGLIFLIALADAIILLGVLVPALPLLFAVGALVGTGHIDGFYAVLCTALGAFAGDGFSFWIGRRYGPQLRQRWPFSRYPEWLARGEGMFRQHGTKAILIARYVGAVRPFVPAIGGMLKLPLRRYVPASALAALLWALTFLLPGWLFGTSLELFAAIAGRLVMLVGMLVGVLALIWAVVVFVWRRLAPRTNQVLARLLVWSQRHPVIGPYSTTLIDPKRPESPSLLLLALLLLAALWAFATLLVAVASGEAGPLAVDQAVHRVMLALRHPLADSALALAASLGDWPVLMPACAGVVAWLLWRRRYSAVWHWLAAIAFGLASSILLGYLLHLPRPPAAANLGGFGFPALSMTLVIIVFGFFAVLIARELPGRRRVWPYVVAGLFAGLIGFARLYLGANWLSDLLGGTFFGLAWVALLGLAYRRRVERSFWIRPLVVVFFGTLVAAAWWYGPRRVEAVLDRFDPLPVVQVMSPAQWLQADAAGPLSSWRNELRGRSVWPLNLQYAGDPEVLGTALVEAGWQIAEPGGWLDLLKTLDDEASADTLRILPASHYGHPQVLMLVAPAAGDADARRVLRLWRTGIRLAGDIPVWVGNAQTLHFSHRWRWLHYWRLDEDDGAALAQVAADARRSGLQQRLRPAAGDDMPALLRLREPVAQRSAGDAPDSGIEGGAEGPGDSTGAPGAGRAGHDAAGGDDPGEPGEDAGDAGAGAGQIR